MRKINYHIALKVNQTDVNFSRLSAIKSVIQLLYQQILNVQYTINVNQVNKIYNFMISCMM